MLYKNMLEFLVISKFYALRFHWSIMYFILLVFLSAFAKLQKVTIKPNPLFVCTGVSVKRVARPI